MAKAITQGLEDTIMHAFGLVNEFIKVCPDTIWSKKFGAWPVWQQIFHPFASIDFFLRPIDAQPEPDLFAPGIAELKISLNDAPSKDMIKAYVEKAQARVAQYIAGLDDAALAAKNEGLSARFNREVNHARTLGLIASHTMYHLGCCDAALREEGIPGVF